ncbi:MAG TPA: metallopeptidase TldD-related protein, partial [Candidatus Limnocylindria bacterium]|nr:metallopeptidase TldD-related protein [Candidatus Limnocylindria bacterium]
MIDATALAQRVLERVPSSAEAEVRVELGREGLTRFARSFIHQNLSGEGCRVTLRLSLVGRVAASSTNSSDDPALDRLVSTALEAARVQPVDHGWPGVAQPASAAEVEHYDDATAGASPDERAARVRGFVDAAEGLEAAGFCSTDGVTAAYANTAGQRLAGRASSAVVDGIARTPGSDGSARAASARLSDLDGRWAGTEAARRARDSADAEELPPGHYEVVLEPGCVANLLYFLAAHGFNGRAVEEGRSFVSLGERQLDPAVTLRDDATDARSVGLLFDVEGTPKRPLDLVRDGVSLAVCHDRRTAKALG